MDEETVRMRVNRAKDHGLIPVWRMMVNSLLIDCWAANLDLRVGEKQQKADVISKVRIIDGLINIVEFRDREISLQLYYANDESLEKKVQLIESICGSPRLELWNIPFPRPEMKMGRLAWEILDAMREDSWMDLEEVAKSVGVSTRSVQRRLSAMKES